MPTEYRIAVIDDDPRKINELTTYLDRTSGRDEIVVRIVAQAQSIDEALALIPTLIEQQVTHVLLDGGLPQDAVSSTVVRYAGELLHEKIKKAYPEIITIDFSSVGQPGMDEPMGYVDMIKLASILKKSPRT